MARGIAKITDAGADILLKCDMKSLAAVQAVTTATGTEGGSGVSYDASLGMLTGPTGYINFDGINNATNLDAGGQIVMTVTTAAICKPDTASTTTGAEARAGTFGALWSAGTSGSTTTQGRVYTTGTGQLTAQTGAGDPVSSLNLLTNNKPVVSEVCYSWDATTTRMIVDEIEVFKGTRTAGVGLFADMVIGAQMNGTGIFAPSGAYYIKDLVISDAPVVLTPSAWTKLGIFGDSFATFANDTNVPYYDGALKIAITKAFISQGIEPPATINVVSGSGETMCDTASANLSARFATFAAQNNELVIVMAGTNDSNTLQPVSEAQVTDPSTGTAANITSLFGLIDGSAADIIYLNVGTFDNSDALNIPANITQRDSFVNPAILSAVNANPKATLMDAQTVFGTGLTNVNYKGYWDEIGNDGSGPGARDTGGTAASITPQSDLHLSGSAGDPFQSAINAILYQVTSAPTLTTPYSIGTNNGPLFVATSSDTIATIEGANFLDGKAGWASLLKTGDVLMMQASNGTKLYNLTVDKQARTIALSTGLTVA
jgi:hypothetical protein